MRPTAGRIHWRTMRITFLVTCLALLGPTACGTTSSSSSSARVPLVTPAMSDSAGRAMVRTELIFGMSRGDDGSPVAEADFQSFVDDSISVWFPGGFTLFDAVGRWRDASGKVVQERSKVLLILHDGSEATLRKFEDLRRLYGQRFGQQTVIRASTNAWVAF